MANANERCLMAMKWRFADALKVLLVPMLLLCAVPASGQSSEAEAQGHLGRVNFQASCLAEAQPVFEKGLALLHSFQYEEAQQTFAELEARERKCAMAHWGKAMALYQQLWEVPDEKKLKEGHKEMEKARKLHPKSPRGQGFLTVAAAFYQKNSKLTHVERTKAYSAALQKFYEQGRDDVEAGAFYALSLVALAEQEVDSLENQKKAIAILDPLL